MPMGPTITLDFSWGEASDDDVIVAQRQPEPSSGNQISEITPKTPGSFYILIKIEPLQPKEYAVTLTKTSADVSITQWQLGVQPGGSHL